MGANASYTLDGGRVFTPKDLKSDSMFGGGILGGLGIEPYLNDYNLDKTYRNTTGSNPNYKPIENAIKNTTDSNVLLIAALIIGTIAIVKTIF